MARRDQQLARGAPARRSLSGKPDIERTSPNDRVWVKSGGDDRDDAAVHVGVAPKADDRSAWARPVLMTAIVTQSISAFELQVAWASPAQSL